MEALVVWYIALANRRSALPTLVSLDTGLRRGQLLWLPGDDTDCAGRHLALDRRVGEVDGKCAPGPPKTHTAYRTVPMTRRLAEALTASIEEGEPSDTVLFRAEPGESSPTLMHADHKLLAQAEP